MAPFRASVAAVGRALLCLALALPELSLPVAQGTENLIVQAAGASFPNLVYQDLIFAYQFVAPNVKMSYVSTGSGGGTCRMKVSSMMITHVLLASHATQCSSCRAQT
jgi:ABC-type phosphate transport system substrate-binding protein